MNGTARPRAVVRIAGGDALPPWFSSGLFAALVWCATAGISALVLLSTDTYHPVTCSAIATAAAVAAWPFRPRPRSREPRAHGPAVAALAIALALLAFAGASHSEHLFTDRDPAVYINTGRSIARTHRIHPRVAPGPFDDTTAFATKSSGFTVRFHRIKSNFLDFLPALLALGWSAGGDTGLLLVPAILGALALLALYALGTAVVGPRWALLGPALLFLAPLQSWFSRDAYSELPLELLALGGVWLLIETRRAGSPTLGVIAGVTLGAITFVRIDALAILIAIPAALALESLRASELDRYARGRRRRALASFAVALFATSTIGLVVSRALDRGYLDDLANDLHLLELAIAGGLAAAVVILGAHRIRPGIGHRLAGRSWLVTSAAVLTAAGAAYAYVWRPRTGGAPAIPAHTLHRAVARRAFNAYYDSASFRWFAWYLGVLTLALAVAGIIVLGIRAVRSDSPALLVLAASLPVTVIYIARPSISPDQLWAMRRYLPVVLPALTIAAAAGAIWSTAAIAAWQPRLRVPAVVFVLAAMLAPAAAAGAPLAGAQMQGGALDAVHRICATAGADGAIAVEPYSLLGTELPQTLRGFCGVPAAALLPEPGIRLAGYAAEWKRAGRRLFVVTATRRAVLDAAPSAVLVAHAVVRDAREPERRVGRRPRRYDPRPVEVWLYRVDPG